jgi:hypothetical protein
MARDGMGLAIHYQQMTAEERSKAWQFLFMAKVLARSANMYPRDEPRVRAHQALIEELLGRAEKVCACLK